MRFLGFGKNRTMRNSWILHSRFPLVQILYLYRGVSGGWAGWAIAHPVFGRIEGAAGRRQRRAALLLAHPVLGSHLRP